MAGHFLGTVAEGFADVGNVDAEVVGGVGPSMPGGVGGDGSFQAEELGEGLDVYKRQMYISVSLSSIIF